MTITAHDEIETATREELIEYLEAWGYQCYDHESTSELRQAVRDNWQTEAGS